MGKKSLLLLKYHCNSLSYVFLPGYFFSSNIGSFVSSAKIPSVSFNNLQTYFSLYLSSIRTREVFSLLSNVNLSRYLWIFSYLPFPLPLLSPRSAIRLFLLDQPLSIPLFLKQCTETSPK